MISDEQKIEAVKEYWNDQARRHETDLAATTPDPLLKKLEIAALVRHLDSERDTLEIGCGNGVNILGLAGYLRGRIVGVDYAEKMVSAAKRAAKGHPQADRLSFFVGDILNNLAWLGSFFQIYTDRCLINLPSLDLQIEAVRNISQILEPGGRLVLIEPVQGGQERINAMRELVGLDPIPYHWHNLYIDEPAFLERIPSDLRHITTDNFASLYYLISRVFNAKLTPKGQTPDYLAEINKIAVMLPSLGDFAPHKLFVFDKIG